MPPIRISIIIPVYNVELYIKKCLDSCLHQNIPSNEYEIIVVNDGSPDHCGAILEEYNNNNENIKVITKENGGLSSARNTGLKFAVGDLIWFVDGDDTIEKNVLRYIVEKMTDNNIEVMTFGYNYLNEEREVLSQKERKLENNFIYSGYELYCKAFVFPFSGAPFYIFRRDFLIKKDLKFLEGIYYEDVLFTTILYTKLHRCLYVDKKLYNYFIHDGSITNSKSILKKGIDNLIITRLLYQELDKLKESNNIYIVFSMIATIIKPIYIQFVGLQKKDRIFLRSEFIKEKYWIESIVKGKKWKNVILYLMIKLGIRIKIN